MEKKFALVHVAEPVEVDDELVVEVMATSDNIEELKKALIMSVYEFLKICGYINYTKEELEEEGIELPTEGCTSWEYNEHKCYITETSNI